METRKIPTCANDWPADGEMLQPMYEAITELKLWRQVAQGPSENRGGFMFSRDQFVSQIYQHPKVVACRHSGASQAFCLRTMQLIARTGFDHYVDSFETKLICLCNLL